MKGLFRQIIKGDFMDHERKKENGALQPFRRFAC